MNSYILHYLFIFITYLYCIKVEYLISLERVMISKLILVNISILLIYSTIQKTIQNENYFTILENHKKESYNETTYSLLYSFLYLIQ